MFRPLTTVERSFLSMARRVVMNPVVMVRCTGTFDPDAVRGAIARVQRRHPALQARVVRRPEPWFSTDGVGTAPLRVVARNGDDHWREVVRHELNDPFDVERGPLIRFVLIQDPADDRCELVCVTDHVNADGRSGLFVLRDVLRVLADPGIDLVPLPDPGCFDTRLPGGIADIGRVPSHLRGMIGDGMRGLRRITGAYARERDRRLGRTAAAPSRPAIELVHRRLSPAQTDALVVACRAHGATVQGALTIACAHALAQVRGHYEAGPGRAHIGCISPIDIRPMMEPSVGDHFGIFAWAPTSLHRMRPGADFWAMARAARSSLARGRSPLALAGLRRLVDACEMLGTDLDGSSSFPHGWLDGTMVVSNLGRVALPRQIGDVHVDSFGFFAMIPNADFVLGVQSLDALELDFCYAPDRLDTPSAERIADVVEATLALAAGRASAGTAALKFD